MQNANKLFNFRESNIRVRLLAFSKKREYKWTGSTSRKVYKVKLSRVFLGRTNLKSFYSSDVGDNIQLFFFSFSSILVIIYNPLFTIDL